MLKISICLTKLTPTGAEYIETYLHLNILSMVTYVTFKCLNFVGFLCVCEGLYLYDDELNLALE